MMRSAALRAGSSVARTSSRCSSSAAEERLLHALGETWCATCDGVRLHQYAAQMKECIHMMISTKGTGIGHQSR